MSADRTGRRKTLAERLWPKVDRSAGPDACWPFTGVVNDRGYGRIRSGVAGEPTIGAHRAAFLIASPDVEPPAVIDHLCHDPRTCFDGDACAHRRCCNPAHLAASTVQENSSADRQWTRAQLTRCSNDHEFTPENTYAWQSPTTGRIHRRCRTCAADKRRSARAAS